jgi:hypothetical protein
LSVIRKRSFLSLSPVQRGSSDIICASRRESSVNHYQNIPTKVCIVAWEGG